MTPFDLVFDLFLDFIIGLKTENFWHVMTFFSDRILNLISDSEFTHLISETLKFFFSIFPRYLIF